MIASLTLSACSQVSLTSAPETQPAVAANPFDNIDPSGQTVVFWHSQTGPKADALKKIVDDFNATNQWGIRVDAEYQGSYNDIFNKMLDVLNTPDAPNLVVAYQDQAAIYQLANGLIDMNPLVNSTKWGISEVDQKDFIPGFWKQDVFPTYSNARLGFPPNRSMEVMYYNSDWLQELGYDTPPTTPGQFKEMACKAARQPFSKATGQGSMGYELSPEASRLASWTFAFGGNVYNYNTNQFSYDSEATQKAMSFIQDLFKEGCASIVTENYGDQSDFGAGKLLFSVDSSSGLPFYDTTVKSGANFNWSVAAIPHTTPDPVMNIYGASISIPKTTPKQELAGWLFLKYYTTPDVQAEWAKASGYFPVRESAARGMKDTFDANPAYKSAFDLLKYGTFEPSVPGYDLVRDKAGEAMAAIANGDPVDATLSNLNMTANQILQEQEAAPLPTPVPIQTAEPTTASQGMADKPAVVAFEPPVTWR